MRISLSRSEWTALRELRGRITANLGTEGELNSGSYYLEISEAKEEEKPEPKRERK